MQTENKSNEESLVKDVFKINGITKITEQRPRSSGFKSFLNWFKKIENQKSYEDDNESSISSSSQEDPDSDGSSSSTATVESFAFLPPNVYKPYGDACQPEKYITPGPYTETYHKLIKERNKRRNLDKNLSLRKKYSLYSSGTINTKRDIKKETTDNKKVVEEVQTYDTFSLPARAKYGENDLKVEADMRKTASLSTKENKTPYHVKGKRKAPLPPVNTDTIRTSRKKRQAPDPPIVNKVVESTPIPASNNAFIFKSDITAIPWFKRQSSEQKSKPKQDNKKRGKHEFPDVGFFRCTRIFDSRKQVDATEDKSEKRVSCFLPNISELDREAAEILKHNKKHSNNYNSPNGGYTRPSSARDLIDKFNALTNCSQDDFSSKSPMAMGAKKSTNSPKLNHVSSIPNTDNQTKNESMNSPDNGDKTNIVLLRGQSESNQMLKNNNKLCVENSLPLTESGDLLSNDSESSFQTEVFSALPNFNLNKDFKNGDLTKPSASNMKANMVDLDEKAKLKEMLKEMKNSLPKRSKQNKVEENDSTASASTNQTNIDPSRDKKDANIIARGPIKTDSIFNTNQINSIANKYKEKLPLILNKDDKLSKIKLRESNKVDSSAQTKCSGKCVDLKDESLKIVESLKTNVPVKIDKQPSSIDNNIYMNLAEGDVVPKSPVRPRKKSDSNVSYVLKQLEAAISEGNDAMAAKLAKDLALLKVKCSVTTSDDVFQDATKSIQIYIEDKFSHQGPISMKVKENMKIIELKQKVFEELNIPIRVQKWIISKQLAVGDDDTLRHYNKGNFDEALFLYIVSAAENDTQNLQNVPSSNMVQNYKDNIVTDSSNNASSSKSAVTRSTTEPSTSKQAELPVIGKGVLNNVNKKTWICSECTLTNSLLSPLCSACGTRNLNNVKTKINSDLTNKDNAETNPNDHYLQLINLDNSDLVISNGEFECLICLSTCDRNAGVVLRECLHTFCKECLANVVKYCEEVQVKCPYRDKDYSCEGVIQEREIKALVNKNTFEKHLAKSISIAENKIQNAFHCKTPNCKGWCIFEENVNDFHCPVCKKTNCLTCQAIHEGRNCKEYQSAINDADGQSSMEVQRTKKMLDDMVSRGEALACPSCQVVLMKKWGCDWVKCSMCKTEICWVTRGARWGPAGKGDTSAGCQCGVNGVKCHPKCNYCH